MTAVAEPTKKTKKAKGQTWVFETATDGQETPAPEGTPLPESEVPLPAEPGEPGFDWQAEYPGERVFIYTTPDGMTTSKGEPYGGIVFGLAGISEKRQPDIDFIRETRRKDQFSQVLDMLELVACDDALAVVGPMKSADLVEMWDQWSEWNKTAAGE